MLMQPNVRWRGCFIRLTIKKNTLFHVPERIAKHCAYGLHISAFFRFGALECARMKNFVIIGAGNMGAAIGRGTLHVLAPERVTIVDAHAEKLTPFAAVGVRVTADVDVVSEADAVLLAVKPQSFSSLCETLPDVPETALVISVMAGVNVKRLQTEMRTPRVVRAMPNLAAALRQSVTLWIAANEVTAAHKTFVSNLFRTIGHGYEVRTEEDIDVLTPVTGSGPAIIACLTEALVAHALQTGMSEVDAYALVAHVVTGTGSLLQSGAYASPEELRSAVTSKGGVTQAFLESVADEDFSGILARALEKATQRSRTLAS